MNYKKNRHREFIVPMAKAQNCCFSQILRCNSRFFTLTAQKIYCETQFDDDVD